MTECKQPYHHNNLKNALIEKGIQLVSTEGVEAFSLRKVASACGVTHAAPYAHFHNKEELLNAMQQYITDKFSETLEAAIQKENDPSVLLKNMGVAYLSFFMDHPHYFSFVYSRSNIKIDLTKTGPDETNYKPFEVYRGAVISLLQQLDYPEEKQRDVVITLWSFIHGVTTLAVMNHVIYDEDWKQKVVDFMEIFECSFFSKERGTDDSGVF